MARGKVSPRYSPKRGGKDADDGDANAWLGTYGDMITLLMAFFVMLYAISQVDQLKFEAFVQGLQEPFGNQATVGMLDGGVSLADGAPALELMEPDPIGRIVFPPPVVGRPDRSPDPASDEATEAQQIDHVDTVQEHSAPVDGGMEVLEIAALLREALKREGLPVDIAEVRPDERGVVISVASDDVLFPLGSARVSPLGQRIVKAVASLVDALPNEVIVEGHTDDLPLRRRNYDNWNLSTDRAVAVLQLLVSYHVPPERLIASGYGEHRPRVANNSKKNRALNRRVDVVLVAR